MEIAGRENFDFTVGKTTLIGWLIGGDVQMTDGSATVYQDADSQAALDLVQGKYQIADVAGSMISAGGATVRITEYGGERLTFIGGSGAATIVTQTGGATIFVGSGSLAPYEHEYDGAVHYNFSAAVGGGTVWISDFRPGTDTFAYSGFTGNPIVSQSVSGRRAPCHAPPSSCRMCGSSDSIPPALLECGSLFK